MARTLPTYSLAERVARTEKVVARFRHHPFSWTGRRTCIHLARAQMRALGHKPPSLPDMRTAVAAKRALKAQGFDDLERLMDSLLPRIAPLEMLPGDLALVPGDEGLDALAISAGSTLLMYHQAAEGLVPVKEALGAVKAAWRV